MAAPTTAKEYADGEIENTENVGSCSNNHKKNFELLDSTYSAAVAGDITNFQQHRMEVDQIMTPNGNTILHIHISSARKVGKEERMTVDFVRRILEMCPDVLWQVNKKGETLLHMAARRGHADAAKLLLAECKKPWQNHDQEGGIEATRRILQMKSYKAKDTALHEAVRYNHLHVVEILTKKDRSLPYEANTAGETPLYLAAERGHREVLKAILDNCDSPADGGPYDRMALHMAVFHNNEDCYWTKKGLAVANRTNKDRWTPLHFAANGGHIEILKKLLAQDKCAAYTADKEGKTALHLAAAGGKVCIMQELLSTCPGCCELVDNKGWNVLHFALTSRESKAIKLVLENPSLENLINEKDDEKGNTPFLQAASLGCIQYFLVDDQISTQVDKLAFNHANHNAADIFQVKSTSFSGVFYPNLALWFLRQEKMGPGMRPTKNDSISKSNSQEGELKEKASTTSSESNDAKDVRFVNEKMEKNLLAATLIATVSFAAGITIPGGFITDKGGHKGTAILTGNGAFRGFVIFNTASLFLSCFAVFFHLYVWNVSSDIGKHMKGLTISHGLSTCALICMIVAFLSGISAVLRIPDKYLAIGVSIVVVGTFSGSLLVVYHGEVIMLNLFNKMECLRKLPFIKKEYLSLTHKLQLFILVFVKMHV